MLKPNLDFEIKYGRLARMIPDGWYFYEPADDEERDTMLVIPEDIPEEKLSELMKESLDTGRDLILPICKEQKIQDDIIY